MKHQLMLLLALTSLLLFTNASDRLRPQRPLNSSTAHPPDHSNSTNHTLSNSTDRPPRPEDHQGRPHLEGLPRVPKGDSNNTSNSRDHQAAHGDNINSTMNKNHTAPHHANETTDSDASRLLAQTNSSQKFDSEDKKKNMNASRGAHPHDKSHNASYFSNKTHSLGDDRNRSIAKNHTTPNSVNATIPSDAPRLLAENNTAHNASHEAYGKGQEKQINTTRWIHPNKYDKNKPMDKNHTAPHSGNETAERRSFQPHDSKKDNTNMSKKHFTPPPPSNETVVSDVSRLLAENNNAIHNASHKAHGKGKEKPMNASRGAYPHEKSPSAPHFANKTHLHGDDRNRSIAKNHTAPSPANETIASEAPRILSENNATHNASHEAYGKGQEKHMNVSKGAYPHEKGPSAPHFANNTHAHDGDKNRSMNHNHTVAANETSNSDGFRLPSGAEEGAMKP